MRKFAKFTKKIWKPNFKQQALFTTGSGSKFGKGSSNGGSKYDEMKVTPTISGGHTANKDTDGISGNDRASSDSIFTNIVDKTKEAIKNAKDSVIGNSDNMSSSASPFGSNTSTGSFDSSYGYQGPKTAQGPGNYKPTNTYTSPSSYTPHSAPSTAGSTSYSSHSSSHEFASASGSQASPTSPKSGPFTGSHSADTHIGTPSFDRDSGNQASSIDAPEAFDTNYTHASQVPFTETPSAPNYNKNTGTFREATGVSGSKAAGTTFSGSSTSETWRLKDTEKSHSKESSGKDMPTPFEAPKPSSFSSGKTKFSSTSTKTNPSTSSSKMDHYNKKK